MAFKRRRRSYWSWDDYPEHSSPLPADGIKAQTRAGQNFGKTWWGGKWIVALERLVNPGRLQRGRSYARRGQVLNIDFSGNRIDSRVQGSRRDPYEVSIEIKSIDDKRWSKVVDVMASQAIFAAKLLAGEMPQDIEDAFGSARVSLFPERAADLLTECSCPDYANPCKHISAVYYLLGERFDSDPFLLFQLRGRSKDQIIAELRARRGGVEGFDQQAGPEKEQALFEGAEADPDYDAGPSLEESVDRFWEMGTDTESMQFTITRPPVDAAPVKRLGQPPFWKSERDFISDMESLYRAISEAAIKTALEE
jgi:uncharacterized Zn finger protein